MNDVIAAGETPAIQSDTHWGGLSMDDLREQYAPTATDKEFKM